MTKIYGLSTELEPEKIVYIGKTSGKLNTRRSTHISSAKSAVKLNKKRIKIYNWILKQLKLNNKIIITLIDEVPDDNWEFYEKYYIKLFKSFGAKLKNDAPGGEGGSVKGKNNPIYGRIGKESGAFNRRRNQKLSKETKSVTAHTKKVVMIDVDTGLILKEFDGIINAANYIGGTSAGIVHTCSDKYPTHTYFGYKWSYFGDKYPIQKLDDNGNILESFSSYRKAANSLPNSRPNAILYSQKYNTRYRGFYWKDLRKQI